jgi:hypothetical protein
VPVLPGASRGQPLFFVFRRFEALRGVSHCFWLLAVDIQRRAIYSRGMPRRLRIEFEGAIYHVMARGNARQKIVRDDADRQRLIDGLEQAVIRCGWELSCYVYHGKSPSSAGNNAPRQPRCRDAKRPLWICDLVRAEVAAITPSVPGTISDGDDRGRKLLLDRQPVHSSQPGACRPCESS